MLNWVMMATFCMCAAEGKEAQILQKPPIRGACGAQACPIGNAERHASQRRAPPDPLSPACNRPWGCRPARRGAAEAAAEVAAGSDPSPRRHYFSRLVRRLPGAV